jgi:hypothetical protein
MTKLDLDELERLDREAPLNDAGDASIGSALRNALPALIAAAREAERLRTAMREAAAMADLLSDDCVLVAERLREGAIAELRDWRGKAGQ